MPLSLEQFGDKIKERYPQYASMESADIAQRVIDKFPVYQGQVDVGVPEAKAETFLGVDSQEPAQEPRPIAPPAEKKPGFLSQVARGAKEVLKKVPAFGPAIKGFEAIKKVADFRSLGRDIKATQPEPEPQKGFGERLGLDVERRTENVEEILEATGKGQKPVEGIKAGLIFADFLPQSVRGGFSALPGGTEVPLREGVLAHPIERFGIAGDEQTGLEGVYQVLGQGAGLIFADFLPQIVRSGFRALPDVIEVPLREVGLGALTTAASQEGVPEAIEKVSEKVGEFKEERPRAFRNVAATLNLVDAIATSVAIYKVGGAGIKTMKKVGQKTKSTIDDVYHILWESADDTATKAKESRFLKEAGKQVDEIQSRWVYEKRVKDELKKRITNSSDDVQKAVGQGIDFGDANRMAASSGGELNKADDMAKLAKAKSLGDDVVPHDNVVGEEFMKSVKHLEGAKKAKGKTLGAIVEALPDERVKDARLIILDRIKKIPQFKKVTMRITKSGDHVLDFSKTALADDIAAQKEIITIFNKAIKKSPAQMHLYRQTLRNQLQGASVTKTKQIQLLDEQVIDSIRGGMKDAIATVSPEYATVSQEFAIIEGALKPVRKQFLAIGEIKNLTDDILNVRSAQLMRRLTSNNRAAVQFMVNQVDATSRLFGYKSDITIAHLQQISNLIDKYFLVAKPTGLAGQVAQGGRVLFGGKKGLTGLAIEAGKKVLKPSAEATMEAFIDFIKALKLAL